MKRILFGLVFLTTLVECTTNYYLVTAEEPTILYSASYGNEELTTIPNGNNYVALGNSNKSMMQWGTFHGYLGNKKRLTKKTKLTPYQYASLVFVEGYGYVDKNSAITRRNPSPSSSPSTTPRSTTQTSSGSGGTVHVRGYTRKEWHLCKASYPLSA